MRFLLLIRRETVESITLSIKHYPGPVYNKKFVLPLNFLHDIISILSKAVCGIGVFFMI